MSQNHHNINYVYFLCNVCVLMSTLLNYQRKVFYSCVCFY